MVPSPGGRGQARIGRTGGRDRQNGRAEGIRAAVPAFCGAGGQSGSPMTEVEPALNSPVDTVGGATPEQTGLPYLSSRRAR